MLWRWRYEGTYILDVRGMQLSLVVEAVLDWPRFIDCPGIDLVESCGLVTGNV